MVVMQARQPIQMEPIMPSHPPNSYIFYRSRPAHRRHGSIRDRLETDAWKNHPGFAARQAGKHQPDSPRKSLRWQDRVLLLLSALLLLLLIFRIETATAQQDRWGLEFRNEAPVNTILH
jgi:hypothetical protein